MTYLPPDSGVPGGQPWPPQQPPPGLGNPQGYPQEVPGYAPQYPQYPQSPGYGQPSYGYPQPGYGYQPQQPPGYGYQPGQPQGFGYPPQGFPPPGYPPQGFPPPKSGGSGKWWLIGGAAVLAVIGLVLAIVLGTSSDGKGPNSTASGRPGSSGSSDEDQIRSLLTSPTGGTDPQQLLEQHFCQNDQEVFKKLGGLGALDVPGGMDGKPTPEVSISDIKVTGSKATADLTVTGNQNPGLPSSTIYFRKESGEWKFCMTDSPALAGLPGLGGH
jgi:hypothetical protein